MQNSAPVVKGRARVERDDREKPIFTVVCGLNTGFFHMASQEIPHSPMRTVPTGSNL